MPSFKRTRPMPKRTIQQAMQRVVLTQVIVSALLLSMLWAGNALLIAHLESLTPKKHYIRIYTP